MFKKNKYFLLLSIIILIGIITTIPSLGKPMIAEMDAYSRVNDAVRQLEEKLFYNYYGGTWLPLHISFLSILISIFKHIQLTPRIFTLTLSLGSILLIFFYTKNIYKNEKISILSSFIYLILPLRFFLGTQTLAEPVFLFFFLLSLILIQPNKIRDKNLFLSLILLNIAHGIRYESWFAIPLIWYFILNKNILWRKKISFLILSIIFPLIWIQNNGVFGNGYLSFFNEKYTIAQTNIPPYYFNFYLSYKNWGNKLFLSLPIIFIILSFFDFRKLIKKTTYSNIFYYSLPIFFFSVLVIQAYLGTMEWFPTRYLIIPITFLIPMISSSIYFFFKLFKIKILKKKSKNIIFFLLIPAILYIFIINYFQIFKKTKLELQDFSFLRKEEKITNNQEYLQFEELINICKKYCSNTTIMFSNKNYIKSDKEQPLMYFSGKKIVEGSKKNIQNYLENENTLLWEKNLYKDETHLINNYSITYENDYFYILE